MHTIFSAPLRTKAVTCTVYWNGQQDWILIDEQDNIIASLYSKTLVERMEEAMEASNMVKNAKAAEQKINRIVSKKGKRAAQAPLAVVAYFATK